MAITEIPIRAQIYTGGNLLVETPYIQSFNVSKNRGTPSTFTASIKIKTEDLDSINNDITIHAGPKGNLIKIFTGFVKKAVINPCWDDPSYFYVNIQGTDILAELEDKGFTRRQTYSVNAWAVIDSVVRTGAKSGKFQYTKEPSLQVSSGEFHGSSSSYIGVAPIDMNVTSPNPKDSTKDSGLQVSVTEVVPNTGG